MKKNINLSKIVINGFLFVEEPIEEIETEVIITADYKKMCDDIDYRQKIYAKAEKIIYKKYQNEYTILDSDVSEFYLKE